MFSAENPPTECRLGHRLGPYRVLVGFERCTCELRGPSQGHFSWTCRVCFDVQYSGGHVDDSKLMNPPPVVLEGLRIKD
jgi:hypothetical protein